MTSRGDVTRRRVTSLSEGDYVTRGKGEIDEITRAKK